MAKYLNSKMVLKDVYIVIKCHVGCINIILIYFTYFIKILQKAAHFVGQFGIQSPITLESFKLSLPLTVFVEQPLACPGLLKSCG